MPSLEEMYRRLLFTYPAEYRRERGDEIVGTLLDAAEPGQSLPGLRETGALLAGGLRTRADAAARGGGRRLWADGLRLGAVLLLTQLLGVGALIAEAVRFARFDPENSMLVVVPALAVIAVVRGATRTGMALLLLYGAVRLGALSTMVGAGGASLWSILAPSTFGSGEYVSIGLCAVLVAAVVPLREARRPWPWKVAVLVIAVPSLLQFAARSEPLWAFFNTTSVIGLHVELITVVPCLALLAFAIIARDPRASIAAGLCVGGPLAGGAYALMTPYTCCAAVPHVYTLPLVLVALSVVATVATMRTRRGLIRS